MSLVPRSSTVNASKQHTGTRRIELHYTCALIITLVSSITTLLPSFALPSAASTLVFHFSLLFFPCFLQYRGPRLFVFISLFFYATIVTGCLYSLQGE